MEVDGQPDRLDLKDTEARRAMEKGAWFALDSDAHTTSQLDNMKYAVGTARRGWVERDRVLNALPLDRLLERLNQKKR
jgi:DNA polymerase (family 10)